MRTVRTVGLLVAASLVVSAAAAAQRVTAFVPVTASGRDVGPVSVSLGAALPRASASAPGGAGVFLANFAGAALGSAAGWGAGIFIADNAYHPTTGNFGNASTGDEAVTGSLVSIGFAALGSRFAVEKTGGPVGHMPRRLVASAIGWAASLGVAAAVFGGLDNSHHAGTIGVAALTHGLVTALLLPKH
jgi:hypothetical protein